MIPQLDHFSMLTEIFIDQSLRNRNQKKNKNKDKYYEINCVIF